MSQHEHGLGEGLLNAAQVGSFLGISKATVYRLADAPDGIPAVQVGPGAVRFLPSDIRAYVERKRGVAMRENRAVRLLAARSA
jgi:predicted DNA-binding transcriptional regulator AlpA